MDDTTPEAREMMSALVMRRSGEERFVMGALMFDAARELVIASLPTDLPPPELKRRLFERVYGFPLPSGYQVSGE
ncbi:MAG TPA: hypothetical protein VJ842_17170 [Pyrinomonadaceae bacterium]|nr:hypothetical protein [Pyrinomonadaceae bacterium]